MTHSDELQAKIDAAKARYQQTRDDPMTPQYLVGAGQSGSLLDYREGDEIGRMICAEEGHRWAGEPEGQVYKFCSSCGIREHKTTGEQTYLYRPDWK